MKQPDEIKYKLLLQYKEVSSLNTVIRFFFIKISDNDKNIRNLLKEKDKNFLNFLWIY